MFPYFIDFRLRFYRFIYFIFFFFFLSHYFFSIVFAKTNKTPFLSTWLQMMFAWKKFTENKIIIFLCFHTFVCLLLFKAYLLFCVKTTLGRSTTKKETFLYKPSNIMQTNFSKPISVTFCYFCKRIFSNLFIFICTKKRNTSSLLFPYFENFLFVILFVTAWFFMMRIIVLSFGWQSY